MEIDLKKKLIRIPRKIYDILITT